MTASTDAACSVVETYDDPDQPCSRPASVLSGSDSDSDLGNVSDDYDWGEDALGPPNEWISKRIARNIMRRDGFCCLVCGLEERLQLTVVRVVAQHADHDLTAQMLWLMRLKVASNLEGRDASDNMMTLCLAHAYAYDCRVWRFVPDENWRRSMLPAGASPENGSKPATLLLVVFRPDEMPAFNLDSSSRVYVANTSPPSNRIWRPVSHSIGLNPALALIAGMEVLRCAYWPPPDRALRGLEADTKTFRDEKNIQMYPDMASEFVY